MFIWEKDFYLIVFIISGALWILNNNEGTSRDFVVTLRNPCVRYVYFAITRFALFSSHYVKPIYQYIVWVHRALVFSAVFCVFTCFKHRRDLPHARVLIRTLCVYIPSHYTLTSSFINQHWNHLLHTSRQTHICMARKMLRFTSDKP